MILKDLITLKDLNTFSIDVYALCVRYVYTEYDLMFFWNSSVQEGSFVLLLGAGSNVLFLENYTGTILLNRIKGINISEDKNFWYLHVCSGELWHELVIFSLKNNMPGLENLALIPGYVGAAPIQNIGAYGVELKKFCEYVDVLNLDIGERIRFTVDECCFDYRSSIFRNDLNFNYAIIAVGLKLSKYWKPTLDYDGLNRLNIQTVTPLEIFYKVCKIRKKKLPNLSVYGNAGSFFKNPIVDINLAHCLLGQYPNLPVYAYRNNLVKLSARWLIDHCYLQKCKFGDAKLYKEQSLILINANQKAISSDIMKLALYIHTSVARSFHVFLEPEVHFIASFGKINGTKLLSTKESQGDCSYNCDSI